MIELKEKEESTATTKADIWERYKKEGKNVINIRHLRTSDRYRVKYEEVK